MSWQLVIGGLVIMMGVGVGLFWRACYAYGFRKGSRDDG
jgi:hypothetical protein